MNKYFSPAVADLNNDAGSMLVTGRTTMDHANDCYSRNKYTKRDQLTRIYLNPYFFVDKGIYFTLYICWDILVWLFHSHSI